MPKTREQNEEIKKQRYEKIINTCIDLFAFKDYASVTVDTITDYADCSHGLFYHYFKNKDEVFFAMMKQVVDEIATLLEPIDIENQPAKKSLEDFINLIINKLKGTNDRYACIFYLLLNLKFKSALPKPPKLKNKLELKKQPLFNIVFYIVSKGQKENDFYDGDPKEYTIALLSMIKGLAYNRLAIGYKKFICPSENILMNLVLKRK